MRVYRRSHHKTMNVETARNYEKAQEVVKEFMKSNWKNKGRYEVRVDFRSPIPTLIVYVSKERYVSVCTALLEEYGVFKDFGVNCTCSASFFPNEEEDRRRCVIC